MYLEINDKLLIEAYYKALELEMSKDFMLLLQEEIETRKLRVVLFPLKKHTLSTTEEDITF